MQQNDLMDKIVSLCKRRGFVFPGSEIYGGLANSWDYGPLGVELKNNIKKLWWDKFVRGRDDIVGIDTALLMNPKVWEASGHVATFEDPLVECKKCHSRYRANQVPSKCEKCGGMDFTRAKQFNLMFKTHVGPVENDESLAYFRPETAQAMFVNFKNIVETSRKDLPFGIAQIGRALRNEITPGHFIFRTREFEQMEIEYFIWEEQWQEYFEKWKAQMWAWITEDLRLKESHVHELEVPDGERAHYSKRTIDFEYDFPFKRSELYGLAYRADFDLKNHFKEAPYRDEETGKSFWPHVVEPTWGVDRTFLAVLCEHFDDSDKTRVVLHLPPKLAPYKVAVFPLLANKPQLVEKARSIYQDLQKNFSVAWDDRGNVGKRYYSQDEIGTPFCITVDFQSLEDGAVTVRNRDTKQQPRIAIADLASYLHKQLDVSKPSL